MAKKHFYDVRWRNELKFEEIHKIENDLNLNEYLRIKGIEFNHLDRLIEEYLSDNT